MDSLIFISRETNFLGKEKYYSQFVNHLKRQCRVILCMGWVKG